MKKKTALFVTYGDEGYEEGLSYTIYLAKMMGLGISVLLAGKKKSLMSRFDAAMGAVAFAEANEHEAARHVLESGNGVGRHIHKVAEEIRSTCRKFDIMPDLYMTLGSIIPAIRSCVRNGTQVDMILLSPSVVSNGNFSPKEMRKLVRISSPVVSLSKTAVCAV